MDTTTHTQYELEPSTLRRMLPEGPGVYLFKDASGRVVYVGKAKSLSKRVLSYFKPLNDLPAKTAHLMRKAVGLDTIITSTENEAFILESTLIRKWMPRYNVVLRDDKRYPSLRLDVAEPFPRLAVVRKVKKDGALYFGPFSSAGAVRSTLKLIDRVFLLRKCRGRGLPERTRPCLNYQMGRCLGACARDVSEKEYRNVVSQVRMFLEGRNRELLAQLRREMTAASELLDFEKAAAVRDQIAAVEKTVERQHVVTPNGEDFDVIGVAQEEGANQVVLLSVRKGAVTGSRDYLLRDGDSRSSEVLEAFIKQYYHREMHIPPLILISEPVEDRVPIMEWLGALCGRRVEIRRPARGEKRRLVTMAVENARHLLAGRPEREKVDLVIRVKRALKLTRTPRHIEGMDISNIQGDMAVGTVVSFIDGTPHKDGYRNFKIKVVEGIDDYAMMAELVSRRLGREPLPDLFLVDGGKGHLSAVGAVLAGYPGARVPEVRSIAKPDEHRGETHDKLYVPGRKNPVSLGADDPVLLLMMRIRDEAHRRAVSYHRRLRSKRIRESDLDLIPGIGAARKRRLLSHFKDINAVAAADSEALTRVPGISRPLARAIVAFFRERDHAGAGEAAG